MTDPLGQVRSEGDALRRASENPDRPIVLIGMWLTLGPTFLSCLGLLIWFVFGAFTSSFGPVDIDAILGIIVCPIVFGGGGAISGILLYKTTRNFLRITAANEKFDREGK